VCLSNFEARALFGKKSAHVQGCASLDVAALIFPHMHSFQDEAEAANDAVFSFRSQQVTKTNR